MKNLLTPRELARLCGVSPDTVRGWCNRRQIKFASTPGGHKRFRRQDVLEFLKTQGFPLPQKSRVSPIRILVVDDDPVFRNSLVGTLQKELDFNVKEASEGYETGRMIGAFDPDVLIFDPKVPGIDGSKICRDIKEKAEVDQKKMVIVVGLPGEPSFQEAYYIGADLCLTKPVEAGRLIELIREEYQGSGKVKTGDTE